FETVIPNRTLNARNPEMALYSALNNDCLLDVFYRLDRDDHDEIATVSKQMLKLSNFARPKSLKVKGYKLHIMQEYFALNIDDIHVFVLDKTIIGAELFKIRTEDDNLDNPYRVRVASDLIERVGALLNRFEFQMCSCSRIIMDTPFLDFLSRLEFTGFCIWNCEFEENVNIEEKARFLSILTKASPTFVSLSFYKQASFIDELFLREFAVCSFLHEFSAYFESEISTHIRPNKSFADSLSRFGTIRMDFLVIDTTWLLSAIIKRLRAKKTGRWNFLITCNIVRKAGNLESDIKYTPLDSRSYDHEIKMLGTIHKVILETSRAGDDLWKIICEFRDE
ncbi:hypothetical protein PMAYCL1PPCAC_25341, partial [Pristionchus mayeri]